MPFIHQTVDKIVGFLVLIIGVRHRAGVQVMAGPESFLVFVHNADIEIMTLLPVCDIYYDQMVPYGSMIFQYNATRQVDLEADFTSVTGT